MSFRSYNRFTKQLITSQSFESTSAIQDKISDLYKGHQRMMSSSLKDRKPLIEEIAVHLKENKASLTELLALEAGIPERMAKKEVQTVLDYSDYVLQKYADHLASINVKTNATKKSLITFNPFGMVYHICGNEAPLWQIFRFMLPNIAAGNSLLIRPPQEALSISRGVEEMLHKAEIEHIKFAYSDPKHYENTFKREEIRAIGYYGPIEEARRVGSMAGKCIKPASIEITNRAVIAVFDDADLNRVAEHWHKSKIKRQVRGFR